MKQREGILLETEGEECELEQEGDVRMWKKEGENERKWGHGEKNQMS